MNIHEIMDVLDNEIKWCLDHPDKDLDPQYQKGFINGLIQAKYLVSELNMTASVLDVVEYMRNNPDTEPPI